jgi:hypothetical protein
MPDPISERTNPSPEALEFAHSCRWPDSRVDLARLLDDFAQERVEKERDRIAPVIEWAREAITAMEARAGWSLAHDQLRKALTAYEDKP